MARRTQADLRRTAIRRELALEPALHHAPAPGKSPSADRALDVAASARRVELDQCGPVVVSRSAASLRDERFFLDGSASSVTSALGLCSAAEGSFNVARNACTPAAKARVKRSDVPRDQSRLARRLSSG